MKSTLTPATEPKQTFPALYRYDWSLRHNGVADGDWSLYDGDVTLNNG